MTPPLYLPTPRDLPVTWIGQALDSILNLAYPENCFICSVPVSRRLDCGICGNCWSRVIALKIDRPRCPSCGLPLNTPDADSENLCGRCITQLPLYSGARSFGHYEAEMRRLIQELKFRGRKKLIGLLSPLMTSVFYECWGRESFELIVPIPLHPKRKRERGYNQSELLARAIAAQTAIPVDVHILIRSRSTLPQVGLSDSQRFENVRKAFRCINDEKISGKRILLVDDVMTTGATVSSAAQTLIAAGCSRVSVLTAARAA
jgi:ComF family protein